MIRNNQKCYQKWLNLLKPIINSKKIKLKKNESSQSLLKR
jgi:hypothetical protein